MCIILDINCLGKFKNQNDKDMEPLRKWFYHKNGKFAYSPTKKFKKEWEKHSVLLIGWMRAGRLKKVPQEKVTAEEDKLRGKIISNDAHIIALARVAKATLLVSNDRDLHQDFKNNDLIGGSVYQNENHAKLLKPDLCP